MPLASRPAAAARRGRTSIHAGDDHTTRPGIIRDPQPEGVGALTESVAAANAPAEQTSQMISAASDGFSFPENVRRCCGYRPPPRDSGRWRGA